MLVGVGIVPANKTLFALGDTVRLMAAGRDANGHAMGRFSFTWSSENEAVATVDAAGLVTAVRTGGTDILAVSGELSAAAGVVVTQLASEVRVTPAVDTLSAVGDTVRLTALAVDRNGHEVEDTDYIWSARHPSVVTVDSNGVVTARGVGTGHIWVRATRAGADHIGVATITVRAAPGPPPDVTLSPTPSAGRERSVALNEIATARGSERVHIVREDDQLVRHSLRPQQLHQPYGLRERDVAVVVPVDQQHRRSPVLHLRDR